MEKIIRRIITLNYDGNPIMTVISCYKPINVSDEDDVTDIYNNVCSFTHYVPKPNVLIIASDFNTDLGIDHNNTFSYI